MKNLLRILACVCLLVSVAWSQTSIGYADPDDIDNLLAYRLPDWGWRIWDLDGSFQGGGHRSHLLFGDGEDILAASSANAAGLATAFTLYRESERRTFGVLVDLAGNWSYSTRDQGESHRTSKYLAGTYRVEGHASFYLGEGDWFLGGQLRGVGSYRENRNEYAEWDWDDSDRTIEKTYGHRLSASGGVGRIRDVTPLIRAQRLSERLVALGRPALTPPQVQQVAQVLAQEYGYRIVFDRPERRFWEEVLGPLMTGDPLSVAEVFYLTDVLREDLGIRRQGARLTALATWEQDGLGDLGRSRPGAELSAEFVKNTSLKTQWNGYLGGRWSEVRDDDYESTTLDAYLGAGLLWNVADRYNLEADLLGSLWRRDGESYGGSYRQDDARVTTTVAFNIYLEDRLVLRPYGEWRWRQLEYERESTETDRGWSWSYGLVFSYRLDRVLL